MARVNYKRCTRIAALVFVSTIAAIFFNAGCGGSGNSFEADKELNVPSIESLIFESSYAGYLVVHVNESDSIRLESDKSFVSRSGSGLSAKLNELRRAHPGAVFESFVTTSEDVIDREREHLEDLSGKKLADWNSIFKVKVKGDEAVSILHDLWNLDGIEKAYPATRPASAGMMTPSLVTHQGYLFSLEEQGGLNAEAAWNRGIYGQDVVVVFNEYGLNPDHVDLKFSLDKYEDGGNVFVSPACLPGSDNSDEVADCEAEVAHGTAGAAIVSALKDDHGVDGFAPQAKYLHAKLDELSILYAIDGGSDDFSNPKDLEPGSIWVIPAGGMVPGCTTSGCVPVDVMPNYFMSIEKAVAAGITVIEGAGNGAKDLDSQSLYSSSYMNLTENDSGSIIVGASWGTNQDKIDFSSCGSSVDLFAWGANVVTAGYPYEPYAWNGDVAPVPSNVDTNSYYVDNYGGTSAATAMIGGAATLIQSYAKNLLGTKKFLMPSKIKNILVTSGVAQSDGGGCNIGMQPRLDAAFDLEEQFINYIKASYPELSGSDPMSYERMKQMRSEGVGIICKKYNPLESDSLCPDSEIYPEGMGAAGSLDFDGDGRADLVLWTNGTWKLDLSSTGAESDGYGAWDIEIEHDPVQAKWVWPYVEDMNSDGRSDFVVYDKENGTWYIRYTDTRLLRDMGLGGKSWEWDEVIDYSSQWTDDRKLDYKQSNYSRPFVGDANDDGWLDITVACSDGIWRVDFGGPSFGGFGSYEYEAEYLSDDQLSKAPGWAYLVSSYPVNPVSEKRMYAFIKSPDGISGEGKLSMKKFDLGGMSDDMYAGTPAIFGGNDWIITPGRFLKESDWGLAGIKDQMGNWLYANSTGVNVDLEAAIPGAVYGGVGCHPAVADYDGDGVSDFAVMCPDEWRLMYSKEDAFVTLRDPNGIRKVGLEYEESDFSLPGRSYSGGISYKYAKQLIEAFKVLHPKSPPPIPIDMITVYTE